MSRPNTLNDPAVRNYLVMCLAVLALILLIMVRRGLGYWGLLPVLVGLLGALLRWRAAPLMLIGFLAGMIAIDDTLSVESRSRSREPAQRSSLEIWILSGALLAYCAAHYRLQGLAVTLFPPDPRVDEWAAPTDGSEPLGEGDQPRSARSVSSWEMSWLIMALPIWAFLGQIAGRLLPTGLSAYGLPPALWRALVLLWLLGGGLLILAGILSYVGRQQMSRREARLWLQDLFWQEIRNDLRRLSRWLAWARLRRRKD
jgi:hypothetical protein